MASFNENENKLEKFEKDIKDGRAFHKKINSIFIQNYDEIIEDIFILNEEIFFRNLKEGVQLSLEDCYSYNCLSDERLIDQISKCTEEIYKKYDDDYSLIEKAWTTNEKTSKGKANNENYLSGFRKHCIYTEDYASHNCCSFRRRRKSNNNCHFICVYNSATKRDIRFVICEACKKVYYSSFILSYCNNCYIQYYTSLLTPEENPDMLCATWKNYHCPKIINEKMKCINCFETFYLNMKNGYLTCLNKKCQLITKPTNILWTCTNCGIEFKSDAIPYNPLDIPYSKKLAEQAVLLKHKAHPKRIPCCKLNVFFTDFFHKIECNGLLYEMELNGKIVVACEKCKKINYYEKFTWTCPKCGSTFKEKNYTSNNSINNENKSKKRNSNLVFEHKSDSKLLIFEDNNNTNKDNKNNIKEKTKEKEEKEESPNISRFRRKYKSKSRIEHNLNFNKINKIINDLNNNDEDNIKNEEKSKRQKKVGFNLEEPENKDEKNNLYKKYKKFGFFNTSTNKHNKTTIANDENNNYDINEEKGNDKINSKINDFSKSRSKTLNERAEKMDNNNTSRDVPSRHNVYNKENNEDKEEKNEKEKIKNFSPKSAWKRRNQNEDQKDKNIIEVFSADKEEKEEIKYKKKRKVKIIEDKEKTRGNSGSKSHNKEKTEQIKQSSTGYSWYKRRRGRIDKSLNEEKPESEELSPTKDNKIKKSKEEKYEEDKDEENQKKEKISMSKIPGVSEHLYNHINKRISAILERCKIPIFNVEDYMFDRKLGEGGYALIFAVYRMDDENCKEYAMKKIIARTLNEIDNFTKEFELVHSCEHPNIMKIYGLCIRMLDQTTFSLYVLMELSTGDWDTDIKNHLMKKESYTEKKLISILRQLTDALLFMQQKLKISHRDIKPQNILLFGEGIYKIADFGEAKESKISKQINTLRGTELYMSPALYSGLKNEENDVNHDPYKSDVFSLGFCLIYAAALNFKLLYQLRDVYDSEQMNNILNQQLKKKYSDTFINILSHMMEIDESQRYDFSQIMNAINTNYDKEGNLKNLHNKIEKKDDLSKRGYNRKYK